MLSLLLIHFTPVYMEHEQFRTRSNTELVYFKVFTVYLGPGTGSLVIDSVGLLQDLSGSLRNLVCLHSHSPPPLVDKLHPDYHCLMVAKWVLHIQVLHTYSQQIAKNKKSGQYSICFRKEDTYSPNLNI